MSKTMTLGSLFDGIGGFCLAGQKAGIRPVWSSEIEPFPIRVTEKRFPDVVQLGDVHDVNGGKITPVDIVTFGSPCQNLSIAGRRAGLDGEQSSLFFEAVRIITEMRKNTNGNYPKWAVWENVPGALSSNDGRDFRQVLQSLAGIADPEADVPLPESGKWLGAGEIVGNHYSLAWRILDASKGWGVAQRRRRIFAVIDLTGTRAGEVLFESEGLSGYTPPGREAWKGTAGGAESRVGAAGFCTEHSAGSRGVGYGEEESPTLRAGVVPGVAIEFNPTDARMKIKEDGICQTLTARAGTGGNNVPLTLKIRSGCEGGGKGALIQENMSATLATNNDQTLFEPKVFGICSEHSNAMLSDNPHSGIYEADTSRTIDTNGGNPVCAQGGMAVVETYALQGSMIGRKDENGPQGDGVNEEVSFTLNTVDRHAVCAMNVGFLSSSEEQAPPLMARDFKDPPLVGAMPSYSLDRASFNQGENGRFGLSGTEESSAALVAKGPNAVSTPIANYTVRRLTPDECCRLQGYPDGWCKDLADGDPSEEEIERWTRIFSVWDGIQGRDRPKTRTQIIKWLHDPNTDAAEYKAYGNSVAVPCVFFVLAGIVWAAEKEEINEQVLELDKE